MSEEGTIPDPGGGGELRESAASEASRRGKAQWDSLSEEEKAERSRKIREGQQKARERKEGKKGGDRAPRPKRTPTPTADTKAADLAMIRELLGGVLAAPSFLGAMRGDPWLTEHFMVRGPALAEAIAEEAARNDAFRAYLVRIAKAARGASLIGAVAMYVLPPLMHFGVAPGAELLGVPVVGPPGPPRPEPGTSPNFVAPERGPAVRQTGEVYSTHPEGLRMQWDPEAMTNIADQAQVPVDELAAELAAHEDGGGMMPPLPMEPV